MNNPQRCLVLCSLVATAAASRLLPHPPNFTAVPAIALFAGAGFARGWLAYLIPVLAMLLTDAVLVAVYGAGSFRYAVPVYACMVAMVALGTRLGRGIRGIALGSVVATITFYLVCNFVVWAVSGMYPNDLGGLAACYLAALPFAGNMLAGTLLFAAALFGLLGWVERRVPTVAA